MSSTWRLLISPPAMGRRNMAIDEAILEAGAPAIHVVDEGGLVVERWDIVRRPTGGRALLHTDELTYSIASPDSLQGLTGGVLPSYRTLSRGLLAGLERPR